MAGSLVAGVYEKAVDRESAYEKLQGRTASDAPATSVPGGKVAAPGSDGGGMLGGQNDVLFGTTGPRGGKHDGLVQTMAKSAVRTVGNQVGREILRGVLGSLFGGKR
jgi:hypothetical protein